VRAGAEPKVSRTEHGVERGGGLLLHPLGDVAVDVHHTAATLLLWVRLSSLFDRRADW